MSDSDAALVARTLAGDLDAYASLMARYRDTFGRYALHMLGNREDAQEAMQDSFVRAYGALARCRDPERFAAWLFRIVVNRCREKDGTITESRGVARRVEDAPPSVLEVRFAPAILSFLPVVWGDYQVMALDDAHTYSLVGTPDRDYLWVLSRTPEMDPAIYDRLVAAAKAQGFDVSRLVRTTHTSSSR